MKKPTITRTTDVPSLRNILFQQIDDLRTGKVEPKLANSINSTASKIISTLRVELAYRTLIGKSIKAGSIKGMLSA